MTIFTQEQLLQKVQERGVVTYAYDLREKVLLGKYLSTRQEPTTCIYIQ